jgi:hypothetical protein
LRFDSETSLENRKWKHDPEEFRAKCLKQDATTPKRVQNPPNEKLQKSPAFNRVGEEVCKEHMVYLTYAD